VPKPPFNSIIHHSIIISTANPSYEAHNLCRSITLFPTFITMHFQSFTVLVTLLAAASAAPASLQARKSVNDCGSSTFENQSSDGSPLITDCQQIATNIAGMFSHFLHLSPPLITHKLGGGTWSIGTGGGGQHQLVQYGTCAFGVNTEDSANVGHIGNQDIIDLINESISRFSYNGKVGAKGKVGCQSATGLVGGTEFIWGLYHD
jgi:hypothetical protein